MKLAPKPYTEGRVRLPDRRQLGYAEFGDPTGDVVLWFHGTPGARKQVPPATTTAAAERGLRVIGVERPGVGLSTNHNGRTLESWAADIDVFADRLGIDRFCVAGLSGGGPHALAVAHDLGDRVAGAAVLGGLGPVVGDEAPGGFLDSALVVQGARLLAPMQAPFGTMLSLLIPALIPFRNQVFGLYARLGPDTDRPVFELPEFRDMFLRDLIDSGKRQMRALVGDAVVFMQPWHFSLRDVSVPVTIWHGGSDRLVPFHHGQYMAELIPGAELVTVPDEGHFAGFVRVEAVLDACVRWFDATTVTAGTASADA
ncbi:MAG: alpha/beta hydrolase [Acidimicrobiia bacterium]|nr:alpha/beta hydrolase [Acidimicrobiia bacterium]